MSLTTHLFLKVKSEHNIICYFKWRRLTLSNKQDLSWFYSYSLRILGRDYTSRLSCHSALLINTTCPRKKSWAL